MYMYKTFPQVEVGVRERSRQSGVDLLEWLSTYLYISIRSSKVGGNNIKKELFPCDIHPAHTCLDAPVFSVCRVTLFFSTVLMNNNKIL
jgi:hypothetical protein